VHNSIGSYILTDDEDDETGAEQREAFKAVAWQVGMPLILPVPALLKTGTIDVESLDQRSPSQMADLARLAQADVVIKGHLIWVGGASGWKADWTLYNDNTQERWAIEGINFDGAFRNALRGAAQIVSGHGEPPPNLN